MNKTILSALTAAALLAGLGTPTPAAAEAPMAKTQAPGWYRHMLGDFEITVLLDGTAKLPVMNLLTNASPDQLRAALQRGFLKETVETSVNAYLVNTGSKLVLIDTGTGGQFGYTAQLLDNLRASGYRPEQVDEIYITHMHGDHLGGVLLNGARAFPNATLRIDKRDTDFWLSESIMNSAPENFRGFFRAAMAAAKPYQEAGKFRPFEGSVELVPGVRSVSSYGHTPGHSFYLVESKGEKLMLWGDMMHVASVQFDTPTVTITFDTDSPKAMGVRQAAYAEAAKEGYLVGIAHVSFPGLGRLRPGPNAGGYTWVPLNYSTLK